MLPAEYSDSDAARGEHKRRKVRKRRRGERGSREGEMGDSREESITDAALEWMLQLFKVAVPKLT